MNLSLKNDDIFADSLKKRLDYSLPRDEFIRNCLDNTTQLHQETNDSSALLFYAMLTLGRFTKGTSAVQRFTELFKELGNDDCATIVSTGNYRKQDLAFYWSTSNDLSHLFEHSTITAVTTYSSSDQIRHLSKTIMCDEWSDYPFHEVDKIPAQIAPKNWGLYNLQEATIAYDTAEFVVLDRLNKPVINLCSANYQHLYFTEMFGDLIINEHVTDNGEHRTVELEDAIMIQDLIRQPNFCHWLLDQLPRLRHLEDSQSIIMYKLAPFMKNMLEIMGIDTGRVYELKERAVVRVGNLTMESSMAVEFCHPCQHANRELISYVENSLSSLTVETKKDSIKRNIYLSRNKYEGRRISNEYDLLSLLEKYEFHTVYPEELSVPEQIVLFKNADVIVSPHGASLANTIFCENVTLVEIFNQNYGTPTFYLIAKLLGFEYQHILGTNPLLSSEEKQRVGLANLQYEDMEVDLEKMEQCLRKVFPHNHSKKVNRTFGTVFKELFLRLKTKLK
ncbi:MAG: hypothetical protein ACJAY2_000770 [Pseudomonadales bacterium]|jgi:hypothetical protein